MKGLSVSLRTVLVATVCLAPVIFGLSAILLQSEYRESRRLRAELNQSYATRFTLERMLTLHLNLETAQRGYVMTGNSSFLEPYEQAEGRIENAFDALAATLGPASALGENLEALRAASVAKRQFTESTVAIAQAGGQEEARELIASGRGKRLMDRIRTLVARMDEQESAGLARRIQQGERSRERVRGIFLGATALLSVLLLLAALLALRMNRARQKAVEQLRESVARQEAVFNSAPDGLILLNQKGQIDHLNPCAAAMFDYESGKLQDRHVTQLFHEAPSSDRVQSFLQSLEIGGGEATAPREFEAMRRDGSHFPVEVMVSPVSGVDERCYLAVVRDITQRKQVETMKNEFVSVVSHELRTPLTSIAGSLGLLAGGAAGALPERAAKLVGIAHSNSTRLVRLVNDILDVEKLQAGMLRLPLRPIALGTLVEQTIQQNQGFANEFSVGLQADSVPSDAYGLGDEDRLVQVLTNLISNAIKFSPAGEIVRVAVTPLHDMIRISVVDRGPGIPEDFRDVIFQKFVQVDSSDTRRKGGTGLGLTIASEIVALMHGKLSFDSEPGRGTSFHVDLCRADEAPEQRAEDLGEDQLAGR